MRFPEELRILGSAAPVADLTTAGATGGEARAMRAAAPLAADRDDRGPSRPGSSTAPAAERRAPLRIWPRAW